MARPKKVKVLAPKDFEEVKDQYTLSLTMGNEVVESSGSTMHEALTALKRPTKINLKGVLIISHGDKQAERLLNPVKIKRLFYKVCHPLLAKQFNLLLK